MYELEIVGVREIFAHNRRFNICELKSGKFMVVMGNNILIYKNEEEFIAVEVKNKKVKAITLSA